MITASIVGASGYAGGELLRILLRHPQVKIKQVTSNRFAGESVVLNHPNLRGVTDLTYTDINSLHACDVLFVSLPNGVSQQFMNQFINLADKVVDLGADFRIHSNEGWKAWYKKEHQNPQLLKNFVYGVPELHREDIKYAKYVAGPGCEAIVSILSLYPLVKNRKLDLKRIIVDAKMGSSQAGNKATDSSHHAERSRVVRTYMPLRHRHTAEIEQELTFNNLKPQVSVTATAIEMVRGLQVTVHAYLNQGTTESDLWKVYRKEYFKEPFISMVKTKSGLYRYPEPKIIQGTNFCDIGFETDSQTGRIVVIGAIDNLVKGTSGNAVQCMNLMCGFDEKLGLDYIGLHPV